VLLGPAAEAVVHRAPVAAGEPHGPPTLDDITRRGTLRVGYDAATLPLAYFNQAGALVGFDVDMAHALARDLGVTLEFVPMDRERVAAELDAGHYDVAMSGIALSAERGHALALTQPYLELTMAFVVRDDRRRAFESRTYVQRLRGLRIGVLGDGYYAHKVREYLPTAEVVTVASLPDYFEGRAGDLDARVHAAAIATAWTLLHPHFTVAVPQPDRLRVPVAYAVARDAGSLRDVLDTWIVLKQRDDTIARLYAYSVLGSDESIAPPRWSVVRNVLGWVD
jgi:ABC-type amino acid transport substrate-binding protein